MLKEVDIEGKVMDVICQGGKPKGNINNSYIMEDRPNNMGIVAYNLMKHYHSSMAELVITKGSRTHPQM